MASVLLILTQDAPIVDSSVQENIKYVQNRMFQSFIGNIDESLIKRVSKGKPDSDPCKWDDCHENIQISCTFSIMYSIEIRDIQQGTFAIAFAPSTLKTLRITDSLQNFRMQTRLLPRDVELVDFLNNEISGTLNLSTLPKRIEQLYLSRNDISGPIHLVNLPQNFRYLTLNYNRIRQNTVFYHNLPENLEQIGIWANEIRFVKPLTKMTVPIGVNIISGLPDAQIR